MKYKLLLLLAILFIYASSCEDDTEIEPFDHAAQSLEDNDSLVKYMQEHFVDVDGIIQEIENGEEAIYDSSNYHSKDVTYTIGGEEVDYKLYYYIIDEGVNDKPARVDQANVAYKGMDLDGNVFDQNAYGGWFDLYSGVIAGWSYGMINFNSGNATELPDGSFEYSETGKGIIFIPSGLAYANSGSGDIGASEPIIFYVEMNDVFHVDHDSDNVNSVDEDIDNNGIYTDDDTDEDGSPNFVDTDDDGDGTLTKYEDANGDGDPTNDGIDIENGDILPDYLDPDIS